MVRSTPPPTERPASVANILTSPRRVGRNGDCACITKLSAAARYWSPGSAGRPRSRKASARAAERFPCMMDTLTPAFSNTLPF